MHLREQYVTDRVVLTIQIQMLGSPDSFPLEQAWDDIEGPKDRWRTTAVSWCFTSYRVLPIISAENSSKRTTAWQMLIPFSKTDQNGDWSIFFCIYSQKKWLNSVEPSRLRPPPSGHSPKVPLVAAAHGPPPPPDPAGHWLWPWQAV